MSVGQSPDLSEGLSLTLTVAPQRRLRSFLNNLPPRFGEAFNPNDVHITVVYPEEIAAAGLSRYEHNRLSEAVPDIHSRVEALELQGRAIDVYPYTILPFKKFMGLGLYDMDGILNDTREVAAHGVNDAIGVRIRDYRDHYHAAIARRRRSDGRRSPVRYESKNFPSALTITGISIGMRSVHVAGRHPKHYRNKDLHADPARRYS